VKIAGPLSKNIAVVNVRPFREEVYALAKELEQIDVIDEVIVADRPFDFGYHRKSFDISSGEFKILGRRR